MRTIEWEAPALASLAAAHWLVAYERENSPRKRVRYENEIEFDGVAYMLMCVLSYVRTCLEGYISFGFDEHYLSEAQIRAVKEAGYED
ncbi:hypothetical protein [Blautia sp.]|uniref:hypothetical protein n=1 Tax=Blautia sp. TaxID=1955243 RepID=UPI003AB3B26E